MKLSERYARVDAIPTALPVFPLRGVILLPRSALPLNIFEPRYLEMFNDALAGNRLLVIVQPTRPAGFVAANDDSSPDDTAESPQDSATPLRPIGTVGRIMAFQELEDGRCIVSLTGIARCRMVDEIATTKPYRTFRIGADEFVRDLLTGDGEQDIPREQLLSTLKKFLEARNLRADWASISRSTNEALVNSLSVMSPYGAEEKQALLEADTLKARAEMLIALAEMELAARGGGSSPGGGSTLQ